MSAAAPPSLSLLVAVAENGVIGRDNALPWRLPDDLKRFKALTMGKPILMGRSTFESIGRALPGRTSLVLTRSPAWSAAGVTVVHSLEEAIARAAGAEELLVIGGAQVYALALPRAARIYLTRVHASVSGDTRLPELGRAAWREVSREEHPPDALHAHAMTFSVLERV
ncbi:MAG TPA: dihydrofolate reductase [Steroidobacteraceae bacterium]|nr:dihydrofolate reductase [Steroidobacteraceae bacterium]